jgi:hypothetical protein
VCRNRGAFHLAERHGRRGWSPRPAHAAFPGRIRPLGVSRRWRMGYGWDAARPCRGPGPAPHMNRFSVSVSFTSAFTFPSPTLTARRITRILMADGDLPASVSFAFVSGTPP